MTFARFEDPPQLNRSTILVEVLSPPLATEDVPPAPAPGALGWPLPTSSPGAIIRSLAFFTAEDN